LISDDRDMKSNGWTLLFHRCLLAQWEPLRDAVRRAQLRNPQTFRQSTNFKLYKALNKVMFEGVPRDPSSAEYRQGTTLGGAYRHWRRVKVGQRFRLFFRYDSASRIIIYTWVNDEETLRATGSRNDAYAIFSKMLRRGNPPDDWGELLRSSHSDWSDLF